MTIVLWSLRFREIVFLWIKRCNICVCAIYALILFAAHNTIDLSQVSVPVRPAAPQPVTSSSHVIQQSNNVVPPPVTSSVQVIQQSVQVLSQPVAYNSQAIAQQSGQVLSQPVASHSQAIAQRQPGQLVVSSMSHLLDPPKLTVRFPSFVTQEKLIQNSIDRSSELTNQPYKSQYTLNLILVVQTSVTRC